MIKGVWPTSTRPDFMHSMRGASAEVGFQRAWGHLLGEEGRGVPTILVMGTYTRLDCVLATTGLMRQALSQAVHSARHRRRLAQRRSISR